MLRRGASLLTTLLLAGCAAPLDPPGGSGSGEPPGGASDGTVASDTDHPPLGPADATVRMLDHRFEPADITLPADPGGGARSVAFVNEGGVAHEVLARRSPEGGEPDDWFAAGAAGPGNRTVLYFTEPGLYEFRCEPHSASFTEGMVGTVRLT